MLKMATRSLSAQYFRTLEADGQKQIECYFAVFDDVYEWAKNCTETIDRHAFDETIDDDIRALINHDTTLVLGRTKAGTLKLSIDDKGLKGIVIINEEDQDALNLYAKVKRGDVNQCSIGFDILAEESTQDNGRYNWHILKIKLYEVSIVTFPAYEKTEANIRENRKSQLFDIWHKRMKERFENVKTSYVKKET